MRPILPIILAFTLILIQIDMSAQNANPPVKYGIVLMDQVPYLVQMDSDGLILHTLSNVSELYKTKASLEEIINIELLRLSSDSNSLAGFSDPLTYNLTKLRRKINSTGSPRN